MSGIIPKEDGAGFQRWKIGAFDTPAPRPSPAAPAEQVVAPGEPMEPGINLPTADDIERIYEEARAEGFRAGQEEGRLAAEQAAQDAANAEAQRFLDLANNMQHALEEIDQQVADQLLALATEIAGQVVSGAITVKTELLLPIIREAIAALPLHNTHLSLRLNPADAAHVRKQLGEQLSQTGTQIIEDGEISPGGCLVRAGTSEVDATIETRWRRVLEAIGAEPLAWLNH
jgi:flagellar assembly protein FliH